MTEYFYDKATGRVAGHFSDGKPVFLASPPTGDELDFLVHECCEVIEETFGPMKPRRIHHTLMLDEGQHSLILTDGETRNGIRCGHGGVRSWITKGTLRSAAELIPVLNAFLADMKFKLRMRKVSPDWVLDSDALIVLSSRFGLQAPKSLAELQAKRATDDAERERVKREHAEQDRARREAFVASPEGAAERRRQAVAEFKEVTIDIVLDALVPPVVFADSERPTKDELLGVRITSDDRRRFRFGIESVVRLTDLAADAIVRVWKQAEQELGELLELVEGTPAEKNLGSLEDYCMKALDVAAGNSLNGGEAAQLTPVENGIPPIVDGVERHLFDRFDAMLKLYDSLDVGIFAYMYRSADWGWVVDVVPETLRGVYEGQCAVHEEARSRRQAAREEVNG